MIEFNNVSFTYSQGPSVSNVSFKINDGEFVAIVGSNGAGKTTTAKLLRGLLKPTSGSVVIDGKDTRTTKTSLLAKDMGFLFQNPDRQICQNTVAKEIAFGIEAAGIKGAVSSREPAHGSETAGNITYAQSRAVEICSKFGFDPESDPFTLSRGQRQKVALASIIALDPKIMILDEPTTGLDYRECMQMMNVIKELNSRGVTVVMVCHDMEVVLDFAKRMIVMSGGSVIADGTPHNIFRDHDIMERASILPPQITELAIRLGGSFYNCDSCGEVLAEMEVSEK